ncbi:MAG: hypothetical protein Q9167_005725 [Letrouitia subvulpina]
MILTQVILAFMAVTMTIFGDAIAIKGVQGGLNTKTGERPMRKEFSVFRASGAAFDLYILALQQFQQQNQTALLSYFQIAANSLEQCPTDCCDLPSIKAGPIPAISQHV